jgi:chromosome segregation ATPase
MEYAQELDKIKQEVENSSRKLEELSGSLQSLSKLQESITSFREDNVLNRIETKIDILAQTDNFELLNFSLENLKSDLIKKSDNLTQKINDGNHLLSQLYSEKNLDSSDNPILTNIYEKITKVDETYGYITQLGSFFDKLNSLYSAVDEVKTNIQSVSEESDVDLIKSKINYLSTKLNDYIQQAGTQFQTGVKGAQEIESIKTSLDDILLQIRESSQAYESSADSLEFLKANFLRINEKFSEINLMIKTSSGENEELNNRFEANLTHFNAHFQKLYDQFNSLDSTFNSNFKEFKSCIQDVYDQFSSVDMRNDFNDIKLHVQTYSNKVLSIAEILEKLNENGFAISIDRLDTLEEKIDALAQSDPYEILNVFMESSKRAVEELGSLKSAIEQKFLANKQESSAEVSEMQGKIEFLSGNLCSLLDKFDNDVFEIRTTNGKILEESKNIKDEISGVSQKISDEFAGLAAPLTSAVEMTCELNESLKQIFSRSDVEVQQQTRELLAKFENVYNSTENNFECLFSASKQFYEKLEEIKNEFSNISYDTNSKINDFISRTDILDLKIHNSLSNSETAVNTLRDISKFAENQINANSENINSLKSGINKLSDDFNAFKDENSEINSKLNKIILNDKENAPIIKNNFEELKEEINKNFEVASDNLEKAEKKVVKNLLEEFKEISKKIENASEVSADTLKTSEDIKNALVYMADWFDKAGKIIEENNFNIKKNSVEKVDVFIKKTEENVIEQIKRVSDKLNRLEIRMESIEGKVEKLYGNQSNREIMNMLSDVLEKVELANERTKSNDLILRRLESLEATLENIEAKKISKK